MSLPATPEHRILAPRRNCWRLAHARRAAVLVDGAPYFAALDWALRRARRSILIVGWDFDGRMELRPDAGPERMALGQLLLQRVLREPELVVRILVWDYSVFYGPSATLPLVLGDDWQEHPRIRLHLDDKHPPYGAHHQKLVCIDDTLAFAGGMDLTVDRWDTSRHAADDPLRRLPDGEPYSPVHDLQMVVDGDAARALGDLARERWRVATGEAPEPAAAGEAPWPPDVAPAFTDLPVAIARTLPALAGRPAVREAGELTLDALSAARRTLYIEAQYLAAEAVGDRLAERLCAEDGPEIVILVTRASHGWVERLVMGGNRDRLIRRLTRADRFDRLRIYHPVVPRGDGDCEVLIHSKLIIVDDDFVRVGSSNLNNRSVGLDTECDLAIEAANDAERRAIARLRERLLAEHLDSDPATVARTVADAGSLIKAVERLNSRPRGLRAFGAIDEDGPTNPIFGTGLLDPEGPFEPLRLLRGGE